jgi:hypothetical protein
MLPESFYCGFEHHLPFYGLREKKPLQPHDACTVGGWGGFKKIF